MENTEIVDYNWINFYNIIIRLRNTWLFCKEDHRGLRNCEFKLNDYLFRNIYIVSH